MGDTILKKPEEWGKILGWRVLDPDGWRKDDKPWEEPITENEYMERLFWSTIQPVKP